MKKRNRTDPNVPVVAEKNGYSAFVELFGGRDYAESDPPMYDRQSSQFESDVLTEARRDPALEVLFLGDHCYLVHEKLHGLVSTLDNLRCSLSQADKHALLRGAVDTGRVKWTVQMLPESGSTANQQLYRVASVRVNELGGRLKGVVERFKGIGMFLTDAVFQQIRGNPTSPQLSVQSVYVEDQKKRRFVIYYELRLSGRCMTGGRLDTVRKLFREATVRSRKMARFYIPLLINWAKSMDLATDRPDSAPRHEATLDRLITDDEFNMAREVSGIELVMLCLLHRFLAEEAVNEDRRKRFLDYVRENSWLSKCVREEDLVGSIPEAIISIASRRKLASLIAEG